MVAMSGDEKMDNYDETLLGERGAASFRSPTRRRACIGADIPVLAFVANRLATVGAWVGQKIPIQDTAHRLDVYTDSEWAQDHDRIVTS